MQAMGNMHIMFKDDNMAGSLVSGVQLQLLWCVHTRWRVIFVGSNFCGKSEKVLKIYFRGFKFHDSNQYRGVAVLHKR